MAEALEDVADVEARLDAANALLRRWNEAHDAAWDAEHMTAKEWGLLSRVDEDTRAHLAPTSAAGGTEVCHESDAEGSMCALPLGHDGTHADREGEWKSPALDALSPEAGDGMARSIEEADLSRSTVTREKDGRFCRIEIELKDTPKGQQLSVCGTEGRITKHRGRECIGPGRVLGTYLEAESGGQITESLAAWFPECLPLLPWHLNGMQAGCAHQREAGWNKRPIDPSKPLDAYGYFIPGDHHRATWNMLTWVTRAEHPEGLLSEPCPECGYRYGSAWLHAALPADVAELAATFAATVTP